MAGEITNIGRGVAYDKRKEFESMLQEKSIITQKHFVDAIVSLDNNANEQTFEGGLLKKKILEQYKKFILKNNINFDLKEIQNLELDQLVKFIVMVSPLANSEKQMCLETKSINDLNYCKKEKSCLASWRK